MTITVVKGLLGKPVEQVTTPSPTSKDSHVVSHTVPQVAVNRTLQNDAVVNNIRSYKSTERERLDTYSKAKETTDEVKREIRDNPDEAIDAHRGLNSSSSRDAFV